MRKGAMEMPIDNGQNIFQRGTMPLAVLALLRRGDMYGYQLVLEMSRASGGKLTTQEGSLYPVLYKLQDQGMISCEKVQVGKRMTRIYYHLEPAGEKRLEELIKEYRELTCGVFQIIGGEDTDEVELRSMALSAPSEELAAMRREAEKNDHAAAASAGECLLGRCSGGLVPKPC